MASTPATDPAAAIDALARPLAEAADLDLVDVVVSGGGSRMRIRVVVDRKGGVDLGTCQQVSRALSRALDDADPVAGRYTLEVTSPGTDWPLSDQRSFDRVEGRTVQVTTAVEDGGPTTTVTGVVVHAGPEAVVVRDDDGTEHPVAYATIRRATQVLPW